MANGLGLELGYPLQASISGVVNSALQLVESFGVTVTTSQNAAITVAVNSLLVLAMLIIRTRRPRTITDVAA